METDTDASNVDSCAYRSGSGNDVKKVVEIEDKTSCSNSGNSKGNSGYRHSVTVSQPTAIQRVLDFLQTEVDGYKAWAPIEIHRRTGIEYGTVRKSLFILKRQRKAFPINHEWSASKVFSDEMTRLLKSVPFNGSIQPCVHALTLNITAKSIGQNDFSESMSNTAVLGTVGVEDNGLRWSHGDDKIVKTTYLLAKGSLTIWLGCTFAPLDFESFIRWMTKVDGCLELLKLPTLEGNLVCWRVCQFGLNFDGEPLNVDLEKSDDPIKSVSMKVYGDCLARLYKKKFPDGSVRPRLELHSTKQANSTMKDFLETLFCCVSGVVEKQQNSDILATGINGINAHIMEMVRKIGQLNDKISGGTIAGSDQKAITEIIQRTFRLVEKFKFENSEQISKLSFRILNLEQQLSIEKLENQTLKASIIGLANNCLTLAEKTNEETQENRKLRSQVILLLDVFEKLAMGQGVLKQQDQNVKSPPIPSNHLYE